MVRDIEGLSSDIFKNIPRDKLVEVLYGGGNLKFSTDSLRRITFQNVCQTAAATV